MYDNSESKIGCPLHGWLNGTPADSEIRVGNQYLFPIKCAYCPACNKYYTTSLAINLGRAIPVNGIPVEKGIVPGESDGQTVYAGPAIPLKTNGKTEKISDSDNNKTRARIVNPVISEKLPARSRTHPEEENQITKGTVDNSDEDRRIVYIDLEVSEQRKQAIDYAAVRENGDYMHSGSISAFLRFVSRSKFVCGHNIIAHDLKYVQGYCSSCIRYIDLNMFSYFSMFC